MPAGHRLPLTTGQNHSENETEKRKEGGEDGESKRGEKKRQERICVDEICSINTEGFFFFFKFLIV